MTRKTFDVAVFGLGTMGTFACLEAARRKASVIAFDQFQPPHNRGSHSGDTRVFREAYGEFADYVPLAQQAGRMWDDLGAEAGEAILERCGMLNIGSKESLLISGITKSATHHKLPLQELSAKEIEQRFPGFDPPQDSIGLYESTAGWLHVNSAIRFGHRRATELGAELRTNARVEDFAPDGTGFRIGTSEGACFAQSVIISAGPGAASLLAELRLPLRVLRKILIWVYPLRPELFTPDRFPVFSFSDSFVYGFPSIDERGVKIAVHWDYNESETDLETSQPPATDAEIASTLQKAALLMPKLVGDPAAALARVTDNRPCLYTMTPDEGFIVDRHPSYRNAYIAAGFSGHGFKFAPAIGAALADLALSGQTSLPIGSMAIGQRFQA